MSGIRILQIAHDHPDWTPGGTEIVAHDLDARARRAARGRGAGFSPRPPRCSAPAAPPARSGRMGRDFVLRTGAYDRFCMTRLDGRPGSRSLAQVLDTVRPDIVHLHGLDRIGAEVIPAVRRLAPNCRIVLTLHDYQLICANDGLLLTTGEGARCRGAQPDRCRRCFPETRAPPATPAPGASLGARSTGSTPSSRRARSCATASSPGASTPTASALVPNAVAHRPVGRDAEGPRARRNRFAFFGNVARHKGALVLLDAAARLKGMTDLRVDAARRPRLGRRRLPAGVRRRPRRGGAGRPAPRPLRPRATWSR